MSLADDLVEKLYPWWSQDFEDIARAVGSMWNHVELYIGEDGGTPGWCVIWSPVTCPTEALPYLAQVVGERLRAGMTDAQMREWIVDRPNAKRGTPLAIARGAQRSLVGGRIVQLFERVMPDGTEDPDGDHFTVYTYEADTPDPAQVWQDLLDEILADMVCNYQVLPGPTWAELEDAFPTWADVLGAGTWAEAEGVHGGISWTH